MRNLQRCHDSGEAKGAAKTLRVQYFQPLQTWVK